MKGLNNASVPIHRALPQVALGLSLAIGSLVGGCSKKAVDVVDSVSTSESAVPVISSVPKSVEHPRESLEQYEVPPRYGKVVDRYFDPKNTRTVVYIADHHALGGGQRGADTQRDIYLILEDIIRSQQSLPLVIEELPIGVEITDIISIFLQSGGSDAELLRSIIQEPNIHKRQAMARDAVGKSNIPAPMFAIFARPEVIPLGSSPQDGVDRYTELWNGMLAATRILHDLSVIKCPEGDMDLAAAQKKFLGGSKNKNIIACYCDIRARIDRALRDFEHSRFVEAPRNEMNAAFQYLQGGNDFVVVVAGVNHLPESMRIMKERSVNRIVIAPNQISGAFPAALEEVIQKFPPTLPDREDQACDRWERNREANEQRERGEAIKKFMMED